MRQRLIGAGFALLGATGLYRWAPSGLRGLGAILMFHHVRPYRPRPFEPNRLLEIEPGFLDALVVRLRALGYEILTLDAAVARLGEGDPARAPFAVLTFDDGYRDTLACALPILERHRAPFTVFVTTGFAERTAPLWWLELEAAVRGAERLEVEIDGGRMVLPAATAAEKSRAYETIYRRLRDGPEDRLRAVVDLLSRRAGIDGSAIADELCLDWGGIATLAAHPLAAIGAHTLTHPRLSRVDEDTMRREIAASRDAIAARIGAPVRHLAYPVGDRGSAGPREFQAALDAGFASAVTTRPGLVHADHAGAVTALPRVSVNGRWQDLRHVEVLLSGAAFALWNRGRRVDVGGGLRRPHPGRAAPSRRSGA